MVIPEGFQHILRVMGTNIDGKHKVMFALTAIKVPSNILAQYCNLPTKSTRVLINAHHRGLDVDMLMSYAKKQMLI